MNVKTSKIVSTTVLTLQAKHLPYIFDIIIQNSRNSRWELAKIV